MIRCCPVCGKEIELETLAGWPDRYGYKVAPVPCIYCEVPLVLEGDEDSDGNMWFELAEPDESYEKE